MDEARLEASVDFLMGRVSADPLVDGTFFFGLLVGSTMSKGMFRGSRWLGKSLGILTADEWGCVPLQLAIWPEASQYWYL